MYFIQTAIKSYQKKQYNNNYYRGYDKPKIKS